MVAAILARCTALIVLRCGAAFDAGLGAAWAGLTTVRACFAALVFAQRAFKAAEIFARPAADIFPFRLAAGVVWPSRVCICFSKEAICSLIWAALLSWTADNSAIVFMGGGLTSLNRAVN